MIAVIQEKDPAATDNDSLRAMINAESLYAHYMSLQSPFLSYPIFIAAAKAVCVALYKVPCVVVQSPITK